MSEGNRSPIKKEFRGSAIEVGHKSDDPESGSYKLVYYLGYDEKKETIIESVAEIEDGVLARHKKHVVLEYDAKDDILRRRTVFAKNGINMEEDAEYSEKGRILVERTYNLPEDKDKVVQDKILRMTEYEYDDESGLLCRATGYIGDHNTLTSVDVYNSIERIKSHTAYGTDGVTVVRVADYEYDKEGHMRQKTDYLGPRAMIEKVEVYDEFEVLEKEKLYNQDGRTLKGERHFYKNGEKRKTVVFRPDGISVFKEINFNTNGVRTSERSYAYLPNSNKIISSKLKEYDPIKWNPEDPDANLIFVSHVVYDLETGFPHKGQLQDAAGNFIESLYYNPKNGERLDTSAVLRKQKMWQQMGASLMLAGVCLILASIFVTGSIIAFLAFGFLGVLIIFCGVDMFWKSEDKAIESVCESIDAKGGKKKKKKKKKDEDEKEGKSFEPGKFELNDEMKSLLKPTETEEKKKKEEKKEEEKQKKPVPDKKDEKEEKAASKEEKPKPEEKEKVQAEKKEKPASPDFLQIGAEEAQAEKKEKKPQKIEPLPEEKDKPVEEFENFKQEYFTFDKKADAHLYQAIMAEASQYQDATESKKARKAFEALRKMGDAWNRAFEARRRAEGMSQMEMYDYIIEEEKEAGITSDQPSIGNFVQEYQMFHQVMREKTAATMRRNQAKAGGVEAQVAPEEASSDLVEDSEDFEG